MKSVLLSPMLVLAGACATAQPPGPGTCDATNAQSLVGQSASSNIAAQAQRLTGATVVRWLLPGQIVTMEYRADRLSIVLDANNRVQAIRCG